MHDVSTSPTTFRSLSFRQKTTEVVKFYLLKFEEQNMTYVTKNYRARTPNNQPNPIDVFIGGRIRHFRKLRRISQVELAASVGTTFQQIQKYENGSNRVSGSRLWMISQSLEVPVALFFEGINSRIGRTAVRVISGNTEAQYRPPAQFIPI